MPDELVDLVERSLVEQRVDSLSCGELARLVLTSNGSLRARMERFVPE
jgi:hypothetical protein